MAALAKSLDLGEVWTLLIPLLHDTPLAPLRRGFSWCAEY
jgi:hypothetical protein